MAGATAALFACVCPNLSAHGTLATLDMPITAAVLVTVIALRRFVLDPGACGALWLGLSLSAAILIKVQALLLVPAVAVESWSLA